MTFGFAQILVLLAGSLLWQAPAAARTDCARAYDQAFGLKAFERELFAADGGNLYSIPARDPYTTHQLNLRALQELGLQPPPQAGLSGRATVATKEERAKLFREITALPAVADSTCGNYRASARIGFCFGRAFAAHLQALRFGLHKASIKKVWLVGELKMQGEKWRYHVATMVRGEDGEWYAFDPVLGREMPAVEWYQALRESADPGGSARLFVTEAGRMFPYNWKGYGENELDRRVFRGFFTDLLAQIRAEIAAGKGKPPVP